MDEKKWLTTAEAAALLDKVDRQVRRYCRDGHLICKKEGKQLLVDADSAQALRQAQNEEAGTEAQEQIHEIVAAKEPGPVISDTEAEHGSDADVDSQPDVNPNQIRGVEDFASHLPALKGENFSFFMLLLEYVAIQTEQGQLQKAVDELENRFRKFIFRARRDRKLLHWMVALYLLNLLGFLAVLFSISGK